MVNLTVFVILALCIFSPLYSLVRGGTQIGGVIIPDITLEDMSDKEYDEYYKALARLTEERLKVNEEKAIMQEFGYDGGDLELCFLGRTENGEYVLETVCVDIYSIGALSKRDVITKYLRERYMCEVTVKEHINAE